MVIQYQLVVKNGGVVSEEGSFFEGISFQIKANNNIYSCNFDRDEHDVVWKISSSDKVIDKLTHPDYVPESNPGEYLALESLSIDQKIVCAAFHQLKLIKNKEYNDYFSNQENQTSVDYEVLQYQI